MSVTESIEVEPPVSVESSTDRNSRLFKPSRWSLRTKLVLSLVTLMTLTVLVIGLIAIAGINRYLVGQLDDQLISATHRSQIAFNRNPDSTTDPMRPGEQGGLGPGPRFLVAPGQAAGTLGAVAYNGQIVRAAALDESGSPTAITLSNDSELASVPASGTPETISIPNLGAYRVIATTGPDGATIITGLPLQPVSSLITQIVLIITVVAAVGLIAAAFGATLIIRHALNPLKRLANTATQVAATPLDSGEVALSVRVPQSDTDPGTEVGQVGAALNHMLEHVSTALEARHQSETRLRNFVADASHELRTPLASIRGYSELTRRADQDLPAVVVKSMERIESESVRMTGLVEDMLLLARLDAGRPIALQPVDLSELLVGVTSDAHVAGPSHRWVLDLPDEPITVTGDSERLHQVFANLLSNARIHTPPNTTVTIKMHRHDSAGITAVAPESGKPSASSTDLAKAPTAAVEVRRVSTVLIEVNDNGPGIPPDLMPEIFERFSRADSSRSRQAGGSGLGLAIAAAIVAAHQGATTVKSRPATASTPGDTTFTITLPS